MARTKKVCAAGQTTDTQRETGELAVRAAGPARLSDRQLVVLSAAAQREDRVIEVPDALKGRAREAFAQALLRRGFAIEEMAGAGQPVWRQNESCGALALVATAAALEALGIEETPAQVSVEVTVPAAATSAAGEQPFGAALPRAGSKLAQLVAMLSAPEGCTVEAAAKALGWLPHTTRAALTGLRRKGHAIERVAATNGEGSRHRIVPAPTASAA